MAVIERIDARTILDSRGELTVEAEVRTMDGYGRAAAPSGASTGQYEVTAFKDGAPEETVRTILEEVEPALVGIEATEQEAVDEVLREIGGPSFDDLGGNGSVAVSLATAKAAANERGLPLFEYLGGTFANFTPFPLGNVVGGGAHAVGGTDIQEFLVAPTEAPSTKVGIEANTRVHRITGKKLDERSLLTGGKGDEGAWIAEGDAETVLNTMREAADEVEDRYDVTLGLGLDVAATELYDGQNYVYGDGERDKSDQIDYVATLCEDYDLIYVEDPLEEEDFEGFAELSLQVDTTICGDDLFVTDADRVERGADLGAADAVLIKPNQVGTLTETWNAVDTATRHGYDVVVSHRSGETTDASIAHIATAFAAPLIKTGVVGGERTAKLNELIRLEEML